MTMHWKFALFTSMTLITLGYFLITNGIIWFVYPDRNEYPIRGIDVSHHQGDIDWKLVAKDDVSFVYIKATEANDFIDKQFLINVRGAQENNLAIGAYHFYSLAYPGKIQAENFVSVISNENLQLPPAIDLEYVGNSKQRPSKKELQDELIKFIDVISVELEQEPMLYTTYDFYEDYLYPEFIGYDIWIRDIFSKPNIREIGGWKIWQYNPNGRIDGIPTKVDLNVLSGKSLSDI